jgi:hypothetical protein
MALYNAHKQSTRDRVIALHNSGIPVNSLAKMMKGLIDRTTIQIWVAEARDPK